MSTTVLSPATALVPGWDLNLHVRTLSPLRAVSRRVVFPQVKPSWEASSVAVSSVKPDEQLLRAYSAGEPPGCCVALIQASPDVPGSGARLELRLAWIIVRCQVHTQAGARDRIP